MNGLPLTARFPTWQSLQEPTPEEKALAEEARRKEIEQAQQRIQQWEASQRTAGIAARAAAGNPYAKEVLAREAATPSTTLPGPTQAPLREQAPQEWGKIQPMFQVPEGGRSPFRLPGAATQDSALQPYDVPTAVWLKNGTIMLTNQPVEGGMGNFPQLPAETIGGLNSTGGIERATTRPGTRGAYTPSAAPLPSDISEKELNVANPILVRQWLENKQNWAEGQIPQSQLARLAAETGLAQAQASRFGAEAKKIGETPEEQAYAASYIPFMSILQDTQSPHYPMIAQKLMAKMVEVSMAMGKPLAAMNPQERMVVQNRALNALVVDMDRERKLIRERAGVFGGD